MGCQYAKCYVLLWLSLHLADSVQLITEEPPEFGARLRPLQKHTKTAQATKWHFLTDEPSPSPPKTNVQLSPKVKSPLQKTAKTTKDRNQEDKVNHLLLQHNYENQVANLLLKKKNLDQSQNLQLNRIEPFWPFTNLSSVYLTNSFKDPHTAFPYNTIPERFKDTTFFFSHVGPNSFEYRAQFHHNLNEYDPTKFFSHQYPDFPPFPAFPDNIGKPHLPEYPSLNDVPFPTIAPEIKRIFEPAIEVQIPDKNKFRKPFKPFDIVLSGITTTKYPKIFQFNEERINIEDFEKQKKLQVQLNSLNPREPENVQRNQLLILHGGIFTVKEPPLYHKKLLRKRRLRFKDTNRISNSH